MESPHDLDPERWVVVSSVPGRCILGGNAHTHPGRIHAWSEESGKLVTISKHDIVDASPLARAWIEGFLSGNEPSFAEWLGVSWDEAEPLYEVGDALYEEWKAALRGFREAGWLPNRETGEDQ